MAEHRWIGKGLQVVKREVKRRGPQPTWEKEREVGEDRRQICTGGDGS